jgi:hypothetical protein
MKRKLILCLALVLGVGLFSWLEIEFTKTKEPRSDGRTLTQWLETGLPKNPFLTRNILPLRSKIAVMEIRSNAVPTLIRMVQTREVIPQSNYARRQRDMAIMGFDVLGTSARSAGPMLAELAKDSDVCVRYAALDSFLHVETNKNFLMPVLLHACHDSNGRVQVLAGAALHFVSPNSFAKAGIDDPLIRAHLDGRRPAS